ncbi:MAG: hypothetical protein L6R19_12750 [Alphaproteobacteria bacterium]|nr:hypothetical protein [Alphaproteobacteria bacterium]
MRIAARVVAIRAAASLAAAASFWPARAGHEAPLYPSYYPQEIRVEAVVPRVAAERLGRAKLQAYVGRAADFGGPMPKSVRSVESLASFVVVRVDPDSRAVKDAGGACAAADAVIGGLRSGVPGFVPHPYPVNAHHADYLQHADLAEAARRRVSGKGAVAGLRLRTSGALAALLVAQGSGPAETGSDVSVEAVDLAGLLAPHAYAFNGWIGPPWLKAGWFHAFLLLGRQSPDGTLRQGAASQVERLQGGAFSSAAQRIELERALVRGLLADCRVMVAGYGLRTEHYSGEYSDGLENVAHDSQAGLNSAIFLRTVKLKDFPWNGWLALGVPTPPAAAWNPFGGFDDAAGRLVWSAVGDPGLFPEPYGAGWTMNRFGDIRTPSGP